jgi:hypothetical protein
MMILKEGHCPKRKEKFEMLRNTWVIMLCEHIEFRACSGSQTLRVALQCPEMMHWRKEIHRGK